MTKWLELAHEKKGYINPTAYYWMGAEQVCDEVGVQDSVIACWYRNQEFSYLSTPGAFTKPGRIILKKLKMEELLDKIVKVNERIIPQMLKAAKRLSGARLKDLSGEELYARWQDWLQKFLYLMRFSAMGTVMEMEEPLLTHELENLLTQKLGRDHPKLGEYFQILTTAPQRTIAGQEEIELLKLRLKQLAQQGSDKEVQAHTKKYSWIAFGYAGPGWNVDDIKGRLEQLSNKAQEVERLIQKKEQSSSVLRNRQQKVEEGLKLSEEERYLFHVLRTLGFWKFERKFRNQQAHELMDDFVREIGRHNGLSIPQVKMIAPHEMEEVLTRGKVDVDLLNARVNECVVVFEGSDYQVLSGEAVEKISREIQASLAVDINISELKGGTAYPGYAKGVVKRVDEPQEMEKLNEGDILISMSTSPQILPAMKRAGAIVTDSGGITCHAAIVAREIKIPTLIGTKIVTKVFKDGDKVEVDADKGVVRKL